MMRTGCVKSGNLDTKIKKDKGRPDSSKVRQKGSNRENNRATEKR